MIKQIEKPINVNHDPIYKDSFELFLKSTNEKEFTRKLIDKIIKNKKINRILEIGGGKGDLIENFLNKDVDITVVEPNHAFSENLKIIDINYIPLKWEETLINSKFDLILVPWVIGHFKSKDFESIIKKIVDCLEPEGKALIFTIDSKNGSWREIHNYFYQISNIKHKPAVLSLDQVIKKYKYSKQTFITNVITKNIKDMMGVLTFDFYIYKKKFVVNKSKMEKYLEKFAINRNKVKLDIVHQLYIISA